MNMTSHSGAAEPLPVPEAAQERPDGPPVRPFARSVQEREPAISIRLMPLRAS